MCVHMSGSSSIILPASGMGIVQGLLHVSGCETDIPCAQYLVIVIIIAGRGRGKGNLNFPESGICWTCLGACSWLCYSQCNSFVSGGGGGVVNP